MSGSNGTNGPGGGLARRVAALETSYLRLVDPPPERPRPRLQVWLCEQGEAEDPVAVNQATGETRPAAALETEPAGVGVIRVIVKVVDDRPVWPF